MFTSLEIHPDVFRRHSEERLLSDTLEVVVAEHQGVISEVQQVDNTGYFTLDAIYSTRRFSRDFGGLVRIMNVDGAVIVLLCEGTGWACQINENSTDFFSSFEVVTD